MSISAVTIADSLAHNGARLTTLVITMPRFLLAELNTHRAFSRNAASSRAIPSRRFLKEATYVPSVFGANQAGMSAGERLSPIKSIAAKAVWLMHGAASKLSTAALARLGVHKQWANRLIEPHMYVSVIVTATDFTNFLKQRMAEGAQPEMQELARAVQMQFIYSRPTFLTEKEWHLPFITDEEKTQYDNETLKLVSAARCARVSYLNHDKRSPSIEDDLKVAYKLLFPKDGGSPHYSPWEHICRPTEAVGTRTAAYNLRGWQSMRYELDTWWAERDGGLKAFWENYQYLGTEQMKAH